MASIPRILVVDTKGQLADIVRAGMTMLHRPHILVDVPSGRDAVDEIVQFSFDLMVTALSLENGATGIDLAERAIREQAGTPILVVAQQGDESPPSSDITGKPFHFVEHPAGDQFLRALRIGLDGEEVVQAEENVSTEFDIGPIPNINLNGARDHIHGILIDSGAIGAMLCDRVGRILVEEGAMGYVDKSVVATALGPSFPQAIKIGPQIGGTGWSLKYYTGDRYSLFALAAGYHHFVIFLFDAAQTAAIGAMTRYGRSGIHDLIDQIGPDAWTYVEEVVVTDREDFVDDVPAEPVIEKRRTSTIQLDEVLPGEPEEEKSVFEEVEPFLEPVDELDLDALFGQDVSDGDDLFGDLEDETSFTFGEEGVSFDEAQDMGLLGD